MQTKIFGLHNVYDFRALRQTAHLLYCQQVIIKHITQTIRETDLQPVN